MTWLEKRVALTIVVLLWFLAWFYAGTFLMSYFIPLDWP